MNVQQLIEKFPEIPRDLHGEPILLRFAETFDALLREARSPSPCATSHDAPNHYYIKLIGPLSIYGYGLATREGVLDEITQLLDRHDADPGAFAGSLLPQDVAPNEIRGPGCA